LPEGTVLTLQTDHSAAKEPPVCPGPPSEQHGPSRFKVPRGSVDTHAHVIGSPPAYPFVATRSYTPPEASPQAYLEMLDATGMTYGVLTQVSVHGTDNRRLCETLRANRRRLRGIAVIPFDCPEHERVALKEAGIVGIRLNVLYGGGVGFDQVEKYATLCHEMGWHLQFLIDAKDLPGLAPRLAKLPVPFLIDHMGHFPTSRGTADEGFKKFLSLVRDGALVRSLSNDGRRAALSRYDAFRASARRGCAGSLRLGLGLAACRELGRHDGRRGFA
jgi:predicted TIM-barrel fold metal-dependent hydrolase